MIVDDPQLIERWTRAGWWGETTIDDMFRACVRLHPDRLALVDAPNRPEFAFGEPERLTFREADRAVDRLAATLLGVGVGKDSIVLVQLPNIVEMVIAFLACARLGAIISPVALAYGPRDVRRIVGHLRPKAILTLVSFKATRPARVALDIAAERHDEAIVVLGLGRESEPGVTVIDGLAGMKGDEEALRQHLAGVSINANEIVTMHWTSGTTGEPKCVPRSHNTWHATGGCCTDAGGLEPGERILAPMQMVHTAGMSGVIMPWLETQGMIALHHPFDMDVYLEQIEAHGINHTVAAPAMLNALLKHGTLDGRDVSSVRSILCGSAPLDAWMIEGFKKRYNIEIVNAFGSTEGLTLLSGPSITNDPVRRARYFPRFRASATRSFAASRTGSAGLEWGVRIAASMDTRLRDLETGAEIDSPGVPGELLFLSPALFPGYWTAEGRLDRRDFDADGYFRSGEIFEIAGEGAERDFFHYVDRLKDVINRGGVKIPTGELEAGIQNHPKVREAAAVGFPDEQLGERICAVVALVPGQALTLGELIEDLKAAQIPRFMLPERLEVIESLPRNASGKVLKRMLANALGPRRSPP